jgi:hypothetical protein
MTMAERLLIEPPKQPTMAERVLSGQNTQTHLTEGQVYHHEPFIEKIAPVILLVTVVVIFFAIKKAFLSYRKSKNKTVWRRIIAVVSIIWLLIASNIVELWEYHGFPKQFGPFLMLGVIPVIIIWGGMWVADAMNDKATK